MNAIQVFLFVFVLILPSDAQECGVSIGSGDIFGNGKRTVDTALPAGCFSKGKLVNFVQAGSVPQAGKMKKFTVHSKTQNANHLFLSAVDENGNATLHLLQDNMTVTASIVDPILNTVTLIKTEADGVVRAKTIAVSEFAPERDPPSEHMRNLVEAESSLAPRPTTNLRGNKGGLNLSRSLQTVYTLDIIVIWTQAAECVSGGLSTGCTLTQTTLSSFKSRVDLAIQETNQAYINSGVNIRLRLVYAYRHPTYVEHGTDVFGTALTELQTKNDGVMDEIFNLRATYGADVVQLIISNTQYCGLGYLGPAKDWMFSVGDQNCFQGYYTMGHEIGHNYGCNHDRGADNQCTDTTSSAYGYRDPQARFRTVMAYDCKAGQCDGNKGGGCTRIAMFSNPTTSYNGLPVGSAQNDCAKQMNANAAAMSNYYPTVTDCSNGMTCTINGVCTCNAATSTTAATSATSTTTVATTTTTTTTSTTKATTPTTPTTTTSSTTVTTPTTQTTATTKTTTTPATTTTTGTTKTTTASTSTTTPATTTTKATTTTATMPATTTTKATTTTAGTTTTPATTTTKATTTTAGTTTTPATTTTKATTTTAGTTTTPATTTTKATTTTAGTTTTTTKATTTAAGTTTTPATTTTKASTTTAGTTTMASTTTIGTTTPATTTTKATTTTTGTTTVATTTTTKATTTTTPLCNGSGQLVLSLKTDSYGSETSWTFKNPLGIVILASNRVYGNNAWYNTTYNIISTCGVHNFTIIDSYGDGICCKYGQGSYSVSWKGVLQKSGGAFGPSETTKITVT